MEELDKTQIISMLATLDELSDEMEPFEGTEEETASLASFLYYLSERDDKPDSAPAADGASLFESECAACHSVEDMTGMLDGWERDEIVESLDKLDELSDEMVPFEGSIEEKQALSNFLYNLGRAD